MLVIRVELWSAITGRKTEIARMRIYNDGAGTSESGDYVGETWFGRDAETLDKSQQGMRSTRRGSIGNWPRKRLHVWNLVGQMLANMGYGPKGPEGWD